jgi:hypothetical protein
MKKLEKHESELIIKLLEEAKVGDVEEIGRIEKSGKIPLMTKGFCTQWYDNIINNVKRLSKKTNG